MYHMDMYFIVYDGEKHEQLDDGSNTVRWKDDKQQYFKNYHAREFTCTCGKVLRVGSKPNHLRSIKHKLHTLETAQDG
ncbi:MAG: hypothetical protein NPIRA05_17200 [Nitrospirales bacterium]|nr:MAG: hypothetical protein NPIRA05_17200 [Nitrospirales bacterium]